MASSSRRRPPLPTTASGGLSAYGSCRRENRRPVLGSRAAGIVRERARPRSRPGCCGMQRANPAEEMELAGRGKSGMTHPLAADLFAPIPASRSASHRSAHRLQYVACAYIGRPPNRRGSRRLLSTRRTKLLLPIVSTSPACSFERRADGLRLVSPEQYTVGVFAVGFDGTLDICSAVLAASSS